MERNRSAAEIWDYIESHHNSEFLRIGNTYAITLDNGMTYLYQVHTDGRLLCICEWFDGYIDRLGSAESGIYYVVKFEKYQVNFFEYLEGMVQTEPIVTLKFSRKEINEMRDVAKTCPPLRLKYEYLREQKRYWIIESYNLNEIVYCINEKTIVDKYLIHEGGFTQPYAIVYRFPFAPNRYGLVSDELIIHPSYRMKIYLADFSTDTYICVGGCSKQKYFKLIELK